MATAFHTLSGPYPELKPAKSSNPFGSKKFEIGDFKHAFLVYHKTVGPDAVGNF